MIKSFRGGSLVVAAVGLLLVGCVSACGSSKPATPSANSANFVQMARDTNKAGDEKDVVFVEVSVDPARDSPARLTAYRQLFRPPPANWVTLTGSAASVAEVWKYFGAGYDRVQEGRPAAIDWLTGKPLTYDIQHSDVVVFLDAAQHERFLIHGGASTAGGPVPATLNSFLSGDGQNDLHYPQASDTWTVKDAFSAINWTAGRPITS